MMTWVMHFALAVGATGARPALGIPLQIAAHGGRGAQCLHGARQQGIAHPISAFHKSTCSISTGFQPSPRCAAGQAES